MEPETEVKVVVETKQDESPPEGGVIESSEIVEEVKEIVDDVKKEDPINDNIILLIGEMKSKIENLEMIVQSQQELVQSQQLVIVDLQKEIATLTVVTAEKVAEEISEEEAITDTLPETEIIADEEIPADIQAQVIERGRFFI